MAKMALINPITVIGAITGETKIFAGMVINDNCPDSITTTGVQKIVALIGIEITSVSHLVLINLLKWLSKVGEKINIPLVARTDNAKPGSIA